MCDEIYIGSNDVTLTFNINTCDDSPASLDGSTVNILISRGNYKIEKECSIVNASQGECSYNLKSEDVPNVGLYFHQIKITYPNGNIYYGDIKSLNVRKNLEEEA